ncbi:MAG: hypothetical protein NC314_03205 [Roseburia sp.]|nr:hypothetical protein [Ruminococcus sp.]MCM1156626.1 hypothetical protein [Roseburia sp.]MCM1241821.1 hypothetical protein [Roseburia sp.]
MISNLFLIAGIILWGYVLTNTLKIKESFGPVLGIAVSMAVLEAAGAGGGIVACRNPLLCYRLYSFRGLYFQDKK